MYCGLKVNYLGKVKSSLNSTMFDKTSHQNFINDIFQYLKKWCQPVLLLHVYSSDALGTGYDVKSSMSPLGHWIYGIRYLRRLRFFISDPNELTEPKFNTHTPKDLHNLIKKNVKKISFFSCKDRVSKTSIFSFF